MEKREVSRYLVVVRVGKRQPASKRALETNKDVKEALLRCSTGEIQLAFNSEDTATVGLLLKSSGHPGGPATGRGRSRDGGDEVIISSEDSTRFCRKVSEGALTNRFPISGKQILEAMEEGVWLLELSR